jgi:hypothetical protein
MPLLSQVLVFLESEPRKQPFYIGVRLKTRITLLF